jgi:hypothetical protein
MGVNFYRQNYNKSKKTKNIPQKVLEIGRGQFNRGEKHNPAAL